MRDESVATRYAEALFSLAQERNTVDAVQKELDQVGHALKSQPALSRALNLPNVPDPVKHDIVTRVFGHHLSPTMVNFLNVVVNHRRTEALEAVVDIYHGLAQAARGEVTAEVQTAVALPEDLHAEVEAQVSRITGRKAKLQWRTDPEILGGIVVRVKDKLIDYSLRRQLNDMKERLLRSS
ncbi:MAG: F0F1 ATP synthase subunit delta [Armatimonadetes bacterium]|nr:F0F1 ATP synthase subunit delta [Armatimonadota bacterium]